MDKILFNEKPYTLSDGGVSVSTQELVLKLVTDDIQVVEDDLIGVTDIEHFREDDTKTAEYKEYTKLLVLTKQFNQLVTYNLESHIEQRKHIDAETGEEVTEDVSVTKQIPQYADVVVVTLFQPTLEDMVKENAEQITELQEALFAELDKE